MYYERPIWGLVLTTTLISVLFGWLYNNTGKSIFAVLLFHTSFNWSHYLFPSLSSDRAGLTLFIVQAVLVVTIVAVWGRQTLANKHR